MDTTLREGDFATSRILSESRLDRRARRARAALAAGAAYVDVSVLGLGERVGIDCDLGHDRIDALLRGFAT